MSMKIITIWLVISSMQLISHTNGLSKEFPAVGVHQLILDCPAGKCPTVTYADWGCKNAPADERSDFTEKIKNFFNGCCPGQHNTNLHYLKEAFPISQWHDMHYNNIDSHQVACLWQNNILKVYYRCDGKDEECNGHGSYNCMAKRCICNDPSWTGLSCNDKPDCGKDGCGGTEQGTCLSAGTHSSHALCHCEEGWGGPHCQDPICDEEHQCGNGYCIAPNTCKCDDGYHGDDCSEECPEGYHGDNCKDPICDGNCNQHGTCTAPNKCECDTNFDGDKCEQCLVYDEDNCNDPICPSYDETGCSGHGTCNASAQGCVCNDPWDGDGCDLISCTKLRAINEERGIEDTLGLDDALSWQDPNIEPKPELPDSFWENMGMDRETFNKYIFDCNARDITGLDNTHLTE